MKTLKDCKVGDTVNLLYRDGSICGNYTYTIIYKGDGKLVIGSDVDVWHIAFEDGSAWNVGGLMPGKFIPIENTFQIGEKINISGATYVVARVNRDTVCLINIKTGERWGNPRECANTYKVTTKELCITGMEWSRAN